MIVFSENQNPQVEEEDVEFEDEELTSVTVMQSFREDAKEAVAKLYERCPVFVYRNRV